MPYEGFGRDAAELEEAKDRFAQSYSFHTDRNHKRWDWPPQPRPRRPWLFWLALGFYVSAVLAAFWVAYRALAGWPVVGFSLLSRIAG